MSNRIMQVRVRDRSLDPAQAELWIEVVPAHITPTTELRGRLTGPICAYAATVEVAYPLRPFLRPLAGRMVIPEPCLWEPQCPFLYRGSMELWQDGQLSDQVEVRRGLRRALLGPTGLRVNGRPLFLHGHVDESPTAESRRAGVNLIVASVDAEPALWEQADLHGFFVLGRMSEMSEKSLADAVHQAQRPSCFGWLLEPPYERWNADFVKHLRMTGANVGVEYTDPSSPLPEGSNFIACPASAAAHARVLGLPLLRIGDGPDSPGVFGQIG